MYSRPVQGGSIFKYLSECPDKFYTKITQPKTKFGLPQIKSDGSCRTRDILKPTYYLKFKQKEINNYLKEFKLPDCMYGGVPKKNNVLNALCHIDNLFFLTIDLKNFFSNVTNNRAHQTLVNSGLTWEEARIITRLTTFKGCLPQGAPTSTILANLSFAPTAILLENFCKERHIIFTAFVDDLTFSSLQNFKCLVPQILKILQNAGFFINLNKIHYKKYCCEITGLFIKKGKLSLPKNMLQHIEKTEIRKYADLVTKLYKAHIKKLT